MWLVQFTNQDEKTADIIAQPQFLQHPVAAV